MDSLTFIGLNALLIAGDVLLYLTYLYFHIRKRIRLHIYKDLPDIR